MLKVRKVIKIKWRSPTRRRACPWPARHDSPLVQGSGGRAGAAPPSMARQRERVTSPSGNGEPPPPAARRPRAGAALAGASRAIALATAPTDGEVTDGGGWKRNEWWWWWGGVRVRWGDKIVSGTHLRFFFLTVWQLIRPERRASSGRPFVNISVL
jgi:hypothetical protein